MSYREYKALAVDCDGPGSHGDGHCEETIFDAVPMSVALVEMTAQRLGWLTMEDGRHYCRKCRAKLDQNGEKPR